MATPYGGDVKRSLAVTTALLLTALASGCSDTDDPDDAPRATDSPTSAGGAGEVENETYPRGADVASFCDVLAEIDDAIDEAQPGSEEDWERILSSFEGLDALGVPDDLPEAAVTELVHVELLVQQSGSVEEFTAAAEASPPTSRAVDDYLDESC